MLDLIIPILFVVILFVSKQAINKILSPHVETVPSPEGEVFPKIETEDFFTIEKEEKPKKRKRSSRNTSKDTLFGKYNNSVYQSSSVERMSSVERSSSMRSKGSSSVKKRNDFAEMLRTSDGARRAFIYSELFNRKYE